MNSIFAANTSRSGNALLSAVVGLTLLAGCAEAPPASDPEAVAEYERINDPMEPLNREIFAGNQAFDKAVFKPAAEGYRDYLPEDLRDRIRDFLNNLRAPVIFVNDVLQGDPQLALDTFNRFFLNSTVGICGLFDPAAPYVPRHDNDVGKTLGVWGVDEGPYVVLPLFGPSNPRDAFGLAVESYADPFDRWSENMGYWYPPLIRGAFAGINRRTENLDSLDEIERTSVDPYSTLRSLYRQYRQSLIDGKPTGDKPRPGLTNSLPNSYELSEETN